MSINVEKVPSFFINQPADLEKCILSMQQKKEIAVDLETDEGRFQYGKTVSLIQIFDGQSIYLIDTIAIQNIESLLEIFKNPNIAKIFHACRSDLTMLKDVYDVNLQNVWDTSLMYKYLKLNREETSLKRLVEEFIGISLPKGEQTSNWLRRPLTESQLTYAANDVRYLFKLKTSLLDLMNGQDSLEWVRQELDFACQLSKTVGDKKLEKVKYKLRESPKKLAFLEFLWESRDHTARRYNKPLFKIASDSTLLEMAENPPRSARAWTNLKGVHHKFKGPHISSTFFNRYQTILRDRSIPAHAASKGYRFNEQELIEVERRKIRIEKIQEVLKTHEKGDLQPIVLSNRMKNHIATDGLKGVMRPWQLAFFKEACEKVALDYDYFVNPIN